MTNVITRYTLGRMSKDLIERLNTYRLKNKLSQPQIAKKLGVTFQTVNRWLNGHMKPNQIQQYHIQKLIQRKSNLTKDEPKGKV